MRLLQRKDGGKYSLTEFVSDTIPRYATLSHTWARTMKMSPWKI
jgi:hypothetical protein